MTNLPQIDRNTLDAQWINTVKATESLLPVMIPNDAVETKSMLDFLDRKLKTIQSIATVVHGRGDEYTVSTFEGALLGGMNDYKLDLDFDNSPIFHGNVAGCLLRRLTLLQRFLRLAFDYFTVDGGESPLYLSFMESVFPTLTTWIHNQTENLTVT